MRSWLMTAGWLFSVAIGTALCVSSDDTPWALGATWDAWVAPAITAGVVVTLALVFMVVAVRSAPPLEPATRRNDPPVEDPRRPQRIWAGTVALLCLALCLVGFGWMLTLFFSGAPGMDGRWGAFSGSVIVALGGLVGLFAAVSVMGAITRLDLADHRARQGRGGD